jgi:tetratricopeptide (TPR) repeat protein
MVMRTLASLAVLLMACPLPAQDNAKRAQELARQAEKLALDGLANFAHAATLFEEAVALAPDDAAIHLRAGLFHLNGPQPHTSLAYFIQARDKGAEPARIHYLAGHAHQLNAQWDEAIAAYGEHKRRFDPFQEPDARYHDADKRIAECKHGKRMMASPRKALVENLGPQVNSPWSDYGALLAGDGTLFFTSRRPNGPQAKLNKATREYFEDIWASRLVDGQWTEASPMPTPLNTPGNDASVGLGDHGNTLLIYRDDKGMGDLFETVRAGDGWTAPKTLGAEINSKHHESSAWITADRQWIYFVSNRPEEKVGGQDIYRSRRDEATGAWGPPENLGPDVNSTYDEEGIYVTPDGNTIYFSSRGHSSMGGYDVFRSSYVNGFWTPAENLGWPINSPDDDLFFVLSDDGTTGWFSSVRPGGLGLDDIHRVSFGSMDTVMPASR